MMPQWKRETVYPKRNRRDYIGHSIAPLATLSMSVILQMVVNDNKVSCFLEKGGPSPSLS